MLILEGDCWLIVKDKEKNIYVIKVKFLMIIKVFKGQVLGL